MGGRGEIAALLTRSGARSLAAARPPAALGAEAQNGAQAVVCDRPDDR